MSEKPVAHNKDAESPVDSAATEKNAQNTSFDSFLFDVGNEDHVNFLQHIGEKQLLEGKNKGQSLFEIATTLQPNDPELLYRQGIALFNFGTESKTKKYLLLANKKFRAATKLQPAMVTAWQAWGDSLLFLGNLSKEHHYHLNAKAKYEHAISHLEEDKAFDDISELYWSYAQALRTIAKRSKEAFDLNKALKAFNTASSNEALTEEFWIDYGSTALEFGLMIHDTRFFVKAIECYKVALQKTRSSELAWLALAEALFCLYRSTNDEDHFCQANECFINAAKIAPQEYTIWYSWAQLLLHSGIQLSDVKRLHSSVEKCHRAYACDSGKASILKIWSDALARIGVLNSQLDLIYEAKNKVSQAVNLTGNTIETLHAEGNLLFALAEYHDTVDYYYQAIEKYQEGLSIDRTVHLLWYMLGHAYRKCAVLEEDPSLFDRANRFLVRAIDLQSHSKYYYEYAYTLYLQGDNSRDTSILEQSILHFEQAFSLQKNAVYLHPKWLFNYSKALDLLGDLTFEDKYYVKAIDMLKRVVVLEPEYEEIHYHIALTYAHLAELSCSEEIFHRALSHFKLAYRKNIEHEKLLLDWGLCYLNLAEVTPVYSDLRIEYFNEAQHKIILAAKWGHPMSYYYLACLYSLKKEYDEAMKFLKKARDYDGLPILEDLIDDEWLENLRNTESFQDFLVQVEQQSEKENFS